MGSLSIWHDLIILLIGLAIVIPFARLLPRAGIPSWVAILAFIPIVPLILLWVLAFRRWPGDPGWQG